MCDIKTKIFQDLTNYYSNSVKYFDIDTLPIEIDYNDILQLKSNVCYSNKQLVLNINFLGVSNNGIICYTGKESEKTGICRYFHSFIFLLYDRNNHCGVMIKSLFTKHITWFNKQMYYNLKLMVCEKIYNFYFMQDINFLPW